jgi:cytochrome c biogenesis protein CcdA
MVDGLNIGYITTLALADAVNPCALAVMTMVLMELLLYDPQKKKNILLGGFAFTLAVFILYFLYGTIMIQFFSHVIPSSGIYSSYIFKGFGLLAILLGLLNLKDYFRL